MRHDGTNTTFVQPADQVVVVTGIDWGTTGGTAGQNAQVVLRLAGSSPVPAQFAFSTGAVADAAGATVGSVLVPNVVVAPGLTMCVGAGGGTLSQLVVHGFLAPDK